MTETKCSTLGFERLLLATDGSESALAAVEETLCIAKICNSSILVLSVIEVNPEYQGPSPR